MSQKLHLYCITNNVNGKKYIGITKQGAARRFQQHVSDSKRYKTVLHTAIKKYGKDAFSCKVLAEAETYNHLLILEQKEIKKQNTMHPNGYNMTFGGDANWQLVTDDQSKRRALNVSKSLLGKPKSALQCKNISAAKKGKPLSDKNLNGIRRKWSRPVICKETGNLFMNGHEVVSWLNAIGKPKASFSGVVSCCKGKSKTAYGFTWEYADGSTLAFVEKSKCKAVIMDSRDRFESVSLAVDWLKKNGNPKAATSYISKCCKGKFSNAYGHFWEYAK